MSFKFERSISDKKIVLLFGCGGNRDQNKRSKMGKIADHYSDKIYLTDDNPRYENPNKIRRDIKKGIKKEKLKKFLVEQKLFLSQSKI